MCLSCDHSFKIDYHYVRHWASQVAQWQRTCLQNAGEVGSMSGLGRSFEEGNGNPLQNSCLGNPMDSGAWRATVHGVAKSQKCKRIRCDLVPKQWQHVRNYYSSELFRMKYEIHFLQWNVLCWYIGKRLDWSHGWSCTDHVADHALITWLIIHSSHVWPCTDHVADHTLLT